MGRHATDITGQRFGSLVARSIASRTNGGAIQWLCDCDCGGAHIATYQSLTKNQCKRCGSCRAAGRTLTPETDHLYEVHIKCPGIGLRGGLIVALDRAGNLVAFGGWSRGMVKSSNPWSYRPLENILGEMIRRELIKPREAGERLDKWEKRSRVRAKVIYPVSDNELRGWWDRAEHSGLMASWPAEFIQLWRTNMALALSPMP